MTRFLIQTNNNYVKTVFAYFAYRDNPTPGQQATTGHSLYRIKTNPSGFYGYAGIWLQTLWRRSDYKKCRNKLLMIYRQRSS